jgi:hypothetical protein
MIPVGVSMIRFGADDLLPGEEPASLFVDDVLHWIAVYTELLTAVEETVGGFTESADLLRKHERFSGHLSFWRERLRQLDPTADLEVQLGSGTVEPAWQGEPT